MSGGESEDGLSAEINVTPMVDVLLSLLIIFMVSQPSPANEQIPLDVPQDAVVQNPSDPNASLLVTVEPDGSVKLGKEPVAAEYEKLVEAFTKNEKAQEDDKVVVKGDEKAKYGAIIRVMAAAHEAGIEQVGIASERL
ncbi:MAG: biopolymer transporter ExbD [Myxococcota bacterium]